MENKELLKHIKKLKYCHKERIYDYEYEDSRFEVATEIGREGYCVCKPEELIEYVKKEMKDKDLTIDDVILSFFAEQEP